MSEWQMRLDGRSLDDCIAEAHGIIDTALAQLDKPPVGVFALMSGGNDSTLLLDVVRDRIDGVIHVNTGIGVPETNQFVRDICSQWGLELHELHPPEPYEDVLWKIGGFPGPMQHKFIYTRIKERALRVLQRELLVKRDDRLIYLSGIRSSESRKRMSYAEPIHREGRVIWVNPLLFWDDGEMRQYRHANPDVPRNPVTEHLHMSGECLCGAFAKPGELDEIAFFYPEVAERIRGLERAFRDKGLPACKWGVRPTHTGIGAGVQAEAAGPLCSSCVFAELPFEEDNV